MSLFSSIWNVLPKNYKWSVALKNIGVGAGKIAASLLAGSFGKKLAPEHVEAVGVAVTILTQSGLEWLHDWAALKWPDSKFL